MSDKYKPKVGDRVRVVIEDVVRHDYPNDDTDFGFDLSNLTISHSDVVDGILISVEKIEPPVETFGPGTVVRSKAVPSLTYAVTTDGYVLLNDGSVRKDSDPFTSALYERIVL